MELALVGSLALLGFELSKDGSKSKPVKKIKKTRFQNEYPIKSDTTLTNTNEMGLVPYFTSEKSQNTNNIVKQRVLENFTGHDQTYKNKCEQEPLFTPKEMKQNIYGSQNVSDKDRLQRYVASGRMDGVRPFQQEHVGKGLNVGPDTKAKGGFHDMTRILPEHNDSYSKQSFAGRIIPGKALNIERPQDVEVDKNRPETDYTGERFPLTKGKSDYTASTRRFEFEMMPGLRGQSNDYSGPIYRADAPIVSATGATRTKDSCDSLGITGPPGKTSVTYSERNYLVPETERENCGTVLNEKGHATSTMNYQDTANTTLRELSQNNNYVGQVYTKDGNKIYNTDAASTTLRDITSVEYQGIATGNKGVHSDKYNANMTQRETTGTTNRINPAASVNSKGRNYSTEYNAEKHIKAGNKAYVPGAGRRNDIQNPNEVMKSVIVKEDSNHVHSLGGLKVTGANNFTTLKHIGKIETDISIPVDNKRNDFDMAQKQLEKNPYAIKIN